MWIRRRQLHRVLMNQLREKEIHQQRGLTEPIRRDAHIDRQALGADGAQLYIGLARGRIHDRVGKDGQRRGEGR